MVDPEVCSRHTETGVHKQILDSTSLCVGLCRILVLGRYLSPPNANGCLDAGAVDTCDDAANSVCIEYSNWNTPMDGGTDTSTAAVFASYNLHCDTRC